MSRRLLAAAGIAVAALGLCAAPAAAAIPPPSMLVWCTALPQNIDGVSYKLVGTVPDGGLYYKFWQGNYAGFPFDYAVSFETTCQGDGQAVGGENLTPQAPASSLVCAQQSNFTDPAPPHYFYSYAGKGSGSVLGSDWYQYWRVRAVGTDLGSFNVAYHCGVR